MNTTSSYGPALSKMLTAFPSAREKHNGYYEHSDNPRFDFRVREDGSIFIHSWTGRTREEILAMGGLKESDISLRGQTYTGPTKDSLDLLDLAIAKCIHPHFLENLGLQSGYSYKGRRYVKIPYFNADGTQHTKIKFRKALDGKYKQLWDEDTPGEIIPYGLHKLDMARDAGYLLIGEGESDAWACWYHGMPYLGVPGVDHHKCLSVADLKAIPKIYVVEEPDQKKKMLEYGKGFYKNVHHTLRQSGYTGEVFCIDFKKATKYKDPSELHNNQSENFKTIMEQAIESAIPANDKDTALEETALTRLMRIAEEAELICSPSGALYARVPVDDHYETVSINEKGSGFRRWLVHRFKKAYGFAPNSDALSQTMSGVQADAEYEGEKTEVHTRIAEHKGCIYLDLANDEWECVEISTDGWRVITCPPVYFRRPSGMLPLPVPTTDGSIDELRELINAKDERDYVLITAWLVGTLHPKGPYPALNLNGERGSTKSKATAILRNMIDPNKAPSRNAPKDDREAAITAQNNMVIALDNLSSMPLWLSDLLCRIATGSGFSARELYTDDAERVFSAKRPIIMNGIEDGIISQGDLLNRTMMVTLTPPDEYRSEEEIDDLFAEKHPRLLGALLSIASVALRDRKSVHLEDPPRMADFAKWVTAAEPALGWQQGTFMEAYTENQANSTSIVMESSPVAKALMQFMDNNPCGWEGLTSDLHTELSKYQIYSDSKTAPKAANKLSGHLKRIASSMRVQGVHIEQPKRTEKGARVILRRISAVDRMPNPVDKPSNPVDKIGQNVDTSNLSTCSISHTEELFQDKFGLEAVDPVDNLPSPSAFYPPLNEEEEQINECKNGRADEAGILSTVSSGSTSARLLPPNRACLKCGARDWQFDDLLEVYTCGGCNHG